MLGDYLSLLLVLYDGVLEGKEESRRVLSANASESHREEEACLGVQLAYVCMAAHRHV